MREQLIHIILLVCTSSVFVKGISLIPFLANGGQFGGQRQRPRQNYCTDLSQPCDYAMGDESGTHFATSRPSCTCRETACPHDWNDASGRTITKEIVMIDNSRMSIQLRYCNEVSASRVCSGDEVSMTMSGFGPVAMSVEKNFCNCEDDVNVKVQTTWIEGHRTFYNYTCYKPTCEINLERGPGAPICREQVTGFVSGTFRRQTFDLCDCPNSMHCLLQESRETDIDEINTISLWKCVA